MTEEVIVQSFLTTWLEVAYPRTRKVGMLKPLGASGCGPHLQAHLMLADGHMCAKGGSRLLQQHCARSWGLEPFPGRAFSSTSFCGQTEAQGFLHKKCGLFFFLGGRVVHLKGLKVSVRLFSLTNTHPHSGILLQLCSRESHRPAKGP